MFHYISGTLEYLDINYAVLDAGGVGYKLTVSLNTHAKISGMRAGSARPTVKLFTYMAVREDGVELYGFASETELAAYKLLITVSGIGPKAAMSILSQMTPEQLAIAIFSDDKKAISKANGIGPKTAARIILELKDKFKNQIGTDGVDIQEISGAADVDNGKFGDALAALAVLGYSKSEAMSALKNIDVKSLEIDDIIKLSLKKLMR